MLEVWKCLKCHYPPLPKLPGRGLLRGPDGVLLCKLRLERGSVSSVCSRSGYVHCDPVPGRESALLIHLRQCEGIIVVI